MKTSLFFALMLLSSNLVGQLNPVDLQIPMGDGQTLAAHLYQPDNCSACPVVLVQTPYNKNFYQFIGLPLGIGQNLNNSNYAIVIMDWRGFFGSSGAAYAGQPTKGEDGYDAVEWMAEQPWCDGNIGTWGPSALGVVQFQTARENPPHLKCICPLVAAPQQRYADYYPGGVLRTEYIEQLDALGFGLGPLVIGNPYYSTLWTVSENNSDYPDEIQVPALMIGGWFDHNIDAMIDFFAGIRSESPLDVRDQHRLLVGPWTHGGSGQAVVGSTTQGELVFPDAGGQETQAALNFFDYHLRNIDNGWDDTPYVTYYQPGENQWTQAPQWPPDQPTMLDLYLRENQLLLTTPAVSGNVFTYTYDPNNPSPTIGGPTLNPDLEQGPFDQVPQVENRDDLLIFTTPEFTDPVALKGKSILRLFVSTDRSDTDFAVRMTDVYPDGRSILVSDAIARLRFRNGFTAPLEALAAADQVYELTIEMPHTAITFPAGHKLRLDISSSNYPRFNRNMNTGEEMYPNNDADVLVNPLVAQNKVHAGPLQLSRISLPVNGLPIGLSELTDKEELLIFPNPANGFIYFETSLEGEIQAALVDLSGRIHLKTTLTNNDNQLDISGLSPGVYVFVITDHNGLKQSQKPVVLH